MSDEPMLVSERWLTYADETLRDLTAPSTEKKPSRLFYQLRPFQQLTDWRKTDFGWRADANPLKADSLDPDTKKEFVVYSRITPFSCKPQTAIDDRFWAIMRGGRWEYLAGDDSKRLENIVVLRDVALSYANAVTAVAGGAVAFDVWEEGSKTVVTDVQLTSVTTDPGGGIPYCHPLAQNSITGDVSSWETRYLVLEKTTEQIPYATYAGVTSTSLTFETTTETFVKSASTSLVNAVKLAEALQ